MEMSANKAPSDGILNESIDQEYFDDVINNFDVSEISENFEKISKKLLKFFESRFCFTPSNEFLPKFDNTGIDDSESEILQYKLNLLKLSVLILTCTILVHKNEVSSVFNNIDKDTCQILIDISERTTNNPGRLLYDTETEGNSSLEDSNNSLNNSNSIIASKYEPCNDSRSNENSSNNHGISSKIGTNESYNSEHLSPMHESVYSSSNDFYDTTSKFLESESSGFFKRFQSNKKVNNDRSRYLKSSKNASEFQINDTSQVLSQVLDYVVGSSVQKSN
ncbi:hypothetical protein AYI70_g9287, partial [Smittium culicis]